MSVTVVIGLQWGDEGKGKIVDYLGKEMNIVARFCGGSNAGHTVVTNQEKNIFALVPSAALHPKPKLVIADGVTIEPFHLVREIKALREKYDLSSNRLIIGRNCIVTLPYHMQLDSASERLAKGNAIGTTGWGIGPTKVDHVARQGVRLFEYIDSNFMKHGGVEERITRQLTYGVILSRVPGMLYHHDQLYEETREELSKYIKDTVLLLNKAIDDGQEILFEGSQGTLLDILHGYYPFVTSSSTIAGAVCTGAGIGPTKITNVIGVLKAYSTRVSQGPFPTEATLAEREQLIISGHEYRHESTTPLRVGWLDLVALRYAIRLNGPTSLALTKLDALTGQSNIKVCVGYKKDGKIVEEFPAAIDVGSYEPIYTKLPGWDHLHEIHNFDDLPKTSKQYINFLERELNTSIKIVSIGAKRAQTIVL